MNEICGDNREHWEGIGKPMDKPIDCGLCPFEDSGYCIVKGERTSESDCPLIEVAYLKFENKPNNSKEGE